MRSAPTVKLMAVKTLHRHLEDGLFAVPRLQREFVWNGNKAARLLDSVSRDMPIGALMVWKAHRKAQYLLRQTLHVLPAFNTANKEIWFLIDGQQRLSVLHQAFKGEVKSNSRQQEVDFSRVVVRVAPRSTEDGEGPFRYRKPNDEYVSVQDILAGNWRRRLRGLTQAERTRARQARAALLRYRVPVVFVDSGDTDEVRDLFVRINSLGTPIAAADRAFARSATLDLREMAWETLQGLPPGFRSLPNEILLQTLALSEGVIDVGERAYDQVVRRWERDAARSAKRKQVYVHRWGRLSKAVSKAADYLQETFQIRGVDELPSGYMLAQLALFFLHHSGAPAGRQRAEIYRWFWATGLGQRYSGRGFRQNIAADAKLFVRLARTGKARFSLSEPIDPGELNRTDYRRRSSLRDTYFALLRLKKPSYITNGEPVPAARYTSRANRKDRHHIFPRALLSRRGVDTKRANALTNICFVVAEENQGIGSKHPRAYFQPHRRKKYFARAMRSHLIPRDSESGIWDANVRRGFRKLSKDRLALICKELEERAGMRLFRRD